MAEALREGVRRPRNFVARYGGEEFVIILPNTDIGGAELVARQLQEVIQGRYIVHEYSSVGCCVSLSFGVAVLIPRGSDSPLELFNAADQALYDAKRQGRNRVVVKPIVQSPTVPH
ncbi:GGDEF domain-containing protein [Thermosynechococcus sp. HN-54]|uniref:GGDEF domain-containing protein n=1 Tax=Thermosynechococcus sp. HN-54 TaxID=2933959 RepID=UPI00202CCD42|nr:GGDEF domain-containing protein [Thermosynechococcus sp. HN-54]URR36793.1 GGDEF domain-containing protein [Thermosynechococcus sp. HN-54]